MRARMIDETPSSTEHPLTRPLRRPPPVTRWGRIAYAVAVLTVILDQLSKFWVLTVLDLPHRFTVPILPVLRLTLVWNPGASFNLFHNGGETGRLLLALFAAGVVAALAIWARRAERPFMALGLGLVMGGAVGNNLVDRLHFGKVADFIDVSGLGFFPWVFNVADSAITVGVVLLVLDSLWPGAKAADAAAVKSEA